MAERFYSGESDGQVTVREGAAKYPLNPRHDLLKDKAPAAFRSEGAWTEQLALALFADAYGNETRAIRLYERLHQRVVINLPERWTISRSRILAHINLIESS